MAVIAPTITAYDLHDYRAQMEQIQSFAKHVHIDLMDGVFTDTKSPSLEKIWWPHELIADIHLMHQKPMEQLEQLQKMRPAMVIIHAEADVHHMHFAAELHKENIKTGLALLQDTTVESVSDILHSFDQALIFSGHLGHHGGKANLDLLKKVEQIKSLHPEVEISWDGGIDENNAKVLINGDVDVLNVGAAIQKASDPKAAYDKLLTVVKG